MQSRWVDDTTPPAAIVRFLQGRGVGVAYQPIADLSSGRVVGVESLARFKAEPPLPPYIWFERAEKVGLRGELEATAISTALDNLSSVPKDTYVSVNCSPAVACSGALEQLLGDLPLDRIIVEITEGEQIDDYKSLNDALASLRARGLRVAIDDAGAGFAGMAHMLEIRPDVIKLDIELTRGIDQDKHRRALVRSLVEYGQAVGATIVAEGIETDEELRALQKLGVGYGQGFFLGRPGDLPPTGFNKIRIPAHRVSRARKPRVVRALVAAAIALLVALPTAALAENAQPGNVLWPVKLKLEDLRLVLARSQQSRLSLHLEFATRRTDELTALAATLDGQRYVSTVVASLNENTRLALEEASYLAGHGGRTDVEALVRATVGRRLETAYQALSTVCTVASNNTCAAARKDLGSVRKTTLPPRSTRNTTPAVRPSAPSAKPATPGKQASTSHPVQAPWHQPSPHPSPSKAKAGH